MKKSCKLLTVFLLAVTLGVFGNLNTVKAKSKIKISNSKITLTVRQSKTLKVKGTKKKPKWSSCPGFESPHAHFKKHGCQMAKYRAFLVFMRFLRV